MPQSCLWIRSAPLNTATCFFHYSYNPFILSLRFRHCPPPGRKSRTRRLISWQLDQDAGWHMAPHALRTAYLSPAQDDTVPCLPLSDTHRTEQIGAGHHRRAEVVHNDVSQVENYSYDRVEDFFLHPALAPAATAGRAAVQPTVDLIHGFRNAGMKVLWTFVSYPQELHS